MQNIIQLKYIPFPWTISEAHWSKTDMFANIVTTCCYKEKEMLSTALQYRKTK